MRSPTFTGAIKFDGSVLPCAQAVLGPRSIELPLADSFETLVMLVDGYTVNGPRNGSSVTIVTMSVASPSIVGPLVAPVVIAGSVVSAVLSNTSEELGPGRWIT